MKFSTSISVRDPKQRTQPRIHEKLKFQGSEHPECDEFLILTTNSRPKPKEASKSATKYMNSKQNALINPKNPPATSPGKYHSRIPHYPHTMHTLFQDHCSTVYRITHCQHQSIIVKCKCTH